jgi:hypothetical protein
MGVLSPREYQRCRGAIDQADHDEEAMNLSAQKLYGRGGAYHLHKLQLQDLWIELFQLFLRVRRTGTERGHWVPLAQDEGGIGSPKPDRQDVRSL